MYIHLCIRHRATRLFRPKAAFNMCLCPPRPQRTLRAPGRPRTWQVHQDLARRPLLAPVSDELAAAFSQVDWGGPQWRLGGGGSGSSLANAMRT